MILLDNQRKTGILGIIHFIGIGGIGMSGIAEILHNLGYQVQGSDAAEGNNTQRLRQYGIKISIGHHARNIEGVSYVVISSAIKGDNPELATALERKIPVIRRAEMLAELMKLKCAVAISGSHGKTTTTSLVACLFEAAGLNPTVINGGVINQYSTNAYVGQGDYLIAEADESDATFIKIPSTIGIITNIDPEHMDYYNNFENLFEAFKSFIRNLPFYGFAVACVDHPTVRRLVEQVTERRIITYGIDSLDAHVIAYNIHCDVASSTFDIRVQLPHIQGATVIEQITIPTPGRHNVLNALAAISVGIELDFGMNVIKNGFKKFAGVKRRFTKVFDYNGTEIIDDYAHHPVEVQATLNAARNIANRRESEVIAVFQPHRYSRLANLFQDFAQAFKDADKTYILDVYAAGEAPIAGVTSDALVSEIAKHQKHVEYLSDAVAIKEILQRHAKPGNLFMMMGAGSISSWAYQLASDMQQQSNQNI